MPKEVRVILLVEDDSEDAFFFSRAIGQARIGSRLQILESGQAAIAFLSGQGRFSDRNKFPLPDLIFLDLKLPKKSGFEVLAWIREDLGPAKFTVSVLSSLASATDRARAEQLGAHHYATKPATGALFQTLADKFDLRWPSYVGPVGWGTEASP